MAPPTAPLQSNMPFYTHPMALCESLHVGDGSRIWAFAHILPGAQLGRECNICDGVFIENDVVLGDNVTVKCGVQLWDGIRLGDDVFVGPNATFTNDLYPRSGQHPATFAPTVVEEGASIGANATVLPGLTIGRCAMVGAGAVVTRSVPPFAIVVGSPARITGYVNAQSAPTLTSVTQTDTAQGTAGHANVRGVRIVRLTTARDLRGTLAAGEFVSEIPFIPKRFFLAYDVPSAMTRGEHAHRTCHQFLVCAKGQCAVVVDDGFRREELLLSTPSLGLYIPPMIWGIQYKYSADAALLVFASDHYDSGDYIRDYAEFTTLVASLA